MKVRSHGARLAVPLLIVMTMATTILVGTVIGEMRASAAPGCNTRPDGIGCWFVGSSTSTSIVLLPPIRYLATRNHALVGRCWFWSRYPPGLDAFNGANDEAIIRTRFENPQCPAPGTVVINVTSRSWEVFRAFRLPIPTPRIRPSIGITNLASLITTNRPTSLNHSERLPDRRLLEVQAYVGSVRITWGDGSSLSYSTTLAYGAGAGHAYALKTCPPQYRSQHPAGPNCHPTLERYPVTVSFAWTGRYRTAGGAWIVLGTVLRSASFTYDVDEVVGLPVRP